MTILMSLDPMALFRSMPGAFAQGLVWGLMALGVYITYRLLDFADLTVDGSLATGGAVAVMLIRSGMHPWAALIFAFLAGMAAGFITGILHTALGIPGILASILTQISLYSINLNIMGSSNQAVSVDKYPLVVSLRYISDSSATKVRLFVTCVLFCVAVVALLYWYFGTEQGHAIRATGCNRQMARAQGINTDFHTVVALMISNGLVGLSGGLYAQYQGAADVNMGRGAIVIGLAAVIIGEAMDRTGLARRLALRCLQLTGGSFSGLLWGFFLGGIALGIVLPSILARMVILCTIASGIIDALKIDPRSRMSSSIVLLAFMAAAAPQFMLLHTSESYIWAFTMLFKGTDITVNFWQYAWQSTLISMVYTVMSMYTVYLVKGKESLAGGGDVISFINQSCRELGPLRPVEIKLMVLVLGMVGGFMVQPWTGIDPVYIFCVLAMLCYLPGIDILDGESISKLGIMFLVFVTGCMAIGFVGGSVGFNAWAVRQVVPLLQGWGENMSIIMAYLAGVGVNFMLTPLAATAAFTPAIGELGQAMNMNPLPVFYAFGYGIDQYILPYEAVYFLYIFITGKVTLRHIIPALAVRALLCGVILVCIAIPWWKFVGIM